MADPEDLVRFGNAAVVAPAGHGKTEMIAKIAALGRRSLVLTHTNAGLQAIRSRLKRLKVPYQSVVVDTIAGWCLKYAHAFPGVAHPPPELPQGAQWDELHRGVLAALRIPAVRQVVEASYDRILIDEYQDCNASQHDLAVALSEIVPTLIFGDAMQGIFEFAGATLSWEGLIHKTFPLATELEEPHRWKDKNPELGAWIAEAREKLKGGHRIDLRSASVVYREANDAFDMSTLFEVIDGREGAIAAIHCNKGMCYQLARAARGGFQAIEEMAARSLCSFAGQWDSAPDASSRLAALRWLFQECFSQKKLADGEAPSPEETAVGEAIRAATAALDMNAVPGALEIMTLSRRLPRWRLHRQELFRDAERAVCDLAAGRCETMLEAAGRVRDRASFVGRKLPQRTVSFPLLLKGLEFNHVVVLDAGHFTQERYAQAKQFYVAISRATSSLAIMSQTPTLQFALPNI